MALVLLVARTSVAADAPVPWDQAEAHVGENTAVEGRVLGIHCSPTSCLLAFDPTFNRFTAVVQAKDFKTLSPEALNERYVGRQVRVHGTIQLLDRKPEILIAQPDDIELVVTKQERAAQQEAAQTAVVDRLDDIIDRLDTIVDRLAATQSRLDQLNAVIAQQNDQIAALAAAMPAPQSVEVPPSYGAQPQPRPGYEALRTVKRGMTADQVARLVGQPVATVDDGYGGYVWDYGYGRTITFDRRNRATALVGFPPP